MQKSIFRPAPLAARSVDSSAYRERNFSCPAGAQGKLSLRRTGGPPAARSVDFSADREEKFSRPAGAQGAFSLRQTGGHWFARVTVQAGGCCSSKTALSRSTWLEVRAESKHQATQCYSVLLGVVRASSPGERPASASASSARELLARGASKLVVITSPSVP